MLTDEVRAPTELRAEPLRCWLAGRSEPERLTLARLWGIEPAGDAAALAEAMLSAAGVAGLLERLQPAERAALELLQSYSGVMPAAILERESGLVRPHGAYADPRAYLLALAGAPSATERLYLLGLVQPVGEGARRHYMLPPDLGELLPVVPLRETRLTLQVAEAPAEVLSAEPALLEERLLGLLALAHDGRLALVPAGNLSKASMQQVARRWAFDDNLSGVSREDQWPYLQFVRRVTQAAGLLRAGVGGLLRVAPDALAWLRLPRIERLRRLLDAWAESDWDELAALEGIRAQRPYSRDLAAARRALLGLIGQAPREAWVDLAAFVAEVRRAEPDYARPDGDYFRWGLRGPAGQPLSGFVHWDAVEGAQIRDVLSCSLRWLGLADAGTRDERLASFRLNGYGTALLCGAAAPEEPPEAPLVVQPSFEVLAVSAAPYARFQLGRFAEGSGGLWKLTRRGIQGAAERGVAADEILSFLAEQSGRAVPQNVAATLREWSGRYGQLTLRRGFVLRAEEPALLEQARRDARVRMPAAEALGERAWLVREGDAAELAERLKRAGYGVDADEAAASPLSERDLAVMVEALEFYAGACELLRLQSDASGAMRRRAARLVRERDLNRALQASQAALRALRTSLGRGREDGGGAAASAGE